MSDKIYEGIFSNTQLKNSIESEMESDCLTTMKKYYEKLGKDLRSYLDTRFPDGDANDISSEQAAKKARAKRPSNKQPNDGDVPAPEQTVPEKMDNVPSGDGIYCSLDNSIVSAE